MKQSKNRSLGLAFCLLLPIFGFLSNGNPTPLFSKEFLVKWLSTAVILYLIWNLLWFFNRYDFKRNIILTVITFVILNSFGYGIILQSGNELKLQPIFRSFFAFAIISIVQYAIKSQQALSTLQVEREQLLSENFKAQIKILQNQIDPHFLFNSFNTLRSMVRFKNKNSEQFIMSLSDYYRQTLQNTHDVTLPLSEEAEILDSYIFLMKSRNESAVEVDIKIDEEYHALHLPTSSLQIVVENCFKHNSFSTESPLMIRIYTTAEKELIVENNIQPKLNRHNDESTEYGLRSLEKRYQLMNVERGISVESNDQYFKTKLRLISV